jgi:hypothetical protein
MKYALLLTALLLAGCFEHTTRLQHINMAEKLCAPNGGINVIEHPHYWYISVNKRQYQIDVTCGNGVEIAYKWEE